MEALSRWALTPRAKGSVCASWYSTSVSWLRRLRAASRDFSLRSSVLDLRARAGFTGEFREGKEMDGTSKWGAGHLEPGLIGLAVWRSVGLEGFNLSPPIPGFYLSWCQTMLPSWRLAPLCGVLRTARSPP